MARGHNYRVFERVLKGGGRERRSGQSFAIRAHGLFLVGRAAFPCVLQKRMNTVSKSTFELIFSKKTGRKRVKKQQTSENDLICFVIKSGLTRQTQSKNED